MYMVFWIEEGCACAQEFPATGLSESLAHAEALRRRQRESGGVSFVTLCSENPDSVGHPGVADPPADYNWTKRRTLARRQPHG